MSDINFKEIYDWLNENYHGSGGWCGNIYRCYDYDGKYSYKFKGERIAIESSYDNMFVYVDGVFVFGQVNSGIVERWNNTFDGIKSDVYKLIEKELVGITDECV